MCMTYDMILQAAPVKPRQKPAHTSEQDRAAGNDSTTPVHTRAQYWCKGHNNSFSIEDGPRGGIILTTTPHAKRRPPLSARSRRARGRRGPPMRLPWTPKAGIPIRGPVGPVPPPRQPAPPALVPGSSPAACRRTTPRVSPLGTGPSPLRTRRRFDRRGVGHGPGARSRGRTTACGPTAARARRRTGHSQAVVHNARTCRATAPQNRARRDHAAAGGCATRSRGRRCARRPQAWRVGERQPRSPPIHQAPHPHPLAFDPHPLVLHPSPPQPRQFGQSRSHAPAPRRPHPPPGRPVPAAAPPRAARPPHTAAAAPV
eukprot:scaffold31102_cov110-Isochrysis_galbana.AAC.2